MLADFALARGPDREVSDLFDAISPHLTLLFVPAGAQGLSIGVAAHAIGTARAFQLSETAGSFASLGMILNALLTTVLVALLVLLAGL
jgi:putative effector of murein hydrolase